jgi:hypothetical protein
VVVPVPVPVQHQIVKQAPHFAYAPARIPSGWHYSSWSNAFVLRIYFVNKAGQNIVFVAARYKGDCGIGKQKTFQLAGVKVYWALTPSEQEAWRCVNGVKLIAATSLPTNRFADVGLGRIAASGHRLRR